jgi:hypothetical protein
MINAGRGFSQKQVKSSDANNIFCRSRLKKGSSDKPTRLKFGYGSARKRTNVQWLGSWMRVLVRLLSNLLACALEFSLTVVAESDNLATRVRKFVSHRAAQRWRSQKTSQFINPLIGSSVL